PAAYLGVARARGGGDGLRAMLSFRPRHFKPVIAVKLGLTDPVSGLIMGETAELLVEDFGISRQAQDEFALLSHQRAIAAQERGVLSEEIVPVAEVKEDVGPRKG